MRSIIAIVIAGSSVAVLRIVAGFAIKSGLGVNTGLVWVWIRIRIIGLCRTIADDDDGLRFGAVWHSDHGSQQHRRSHEDGRSCVSHFRTPPVAHPTLLNATRKSRHHEAILAYDQSQNHTLFHCSARSPQRSGLRFMFGSRFRQRHSRLAFQERKTGGLITPGLSAVSQSKACEHANNESLGGNGRRRSL